MRARGKSRRGTIAVFAVVAFVLPVSARADDACAPPRCVDVDVPAPGLTVPQKRVRILLPESYDDVTQYPVVYVLHGVGDTYQSWSQNTDLVAFTEDVDAIFVMPDAGSGPEAGWYSDWQDDSRQWEAFHTGVLVDYVDDTYATLGDGHRGALGISMGGFGAMSYAARHPGLFDAAASLSGMVDSMYGYPASGPFFDRAGEGFGGQSLGTPREEVWGNQLTNEDEWRAHNPTDLAGALAGTWLYVAAGLGTPGSEAGEQPTRPHSYATENFVFQMNVSFTRALDDADVPYISDFGPGYHHWPYWQAKFHHVLPLLVEEIDAD